MAIEMKYICDRCKASQDTAEQMWDVAITCEANNLYRGQYYAPTKQQQAMWCRKCVDAVGVMAPMILRAESQPVKSTIEDMIRAIVREEQE